MARLMHIQFNEWSGCGCVCVCGKEMQLNESVVTGNLFTSCSSFSTLNYINYLICLPFLSHFKYIVGRGCVINNNTNDMGTALY